MILVYLPREEAALGIDRGSGIVSTSQRQDALPRVKIDFEGNRYGADNLRRYVERVMHAADRQLVNYPTVARMHVNWWQVDEIGWFDPEVGRVYVDYAALPMLARWLEVDEIPESELVL